jgi:cytochrome c oxidase accessory protein FixG
MASPIAIAVLPDAGESLYAPQAKVYPREIDGRFVRLRRAAVFVLLGLFYLVPWLRWDGRQAVLFDLPARKFYVLGLVFWPQDFFWLACLLIIAGVSLFFFTAVAGRLWCGYACPQTVWTEVFLWMERLCEGRRNQRIKLDASRWSAQKTWRKSAKQFLWVTFALWTGFTFVGFFTPVVDLAQEVRAASLGGWETFWILFYAFATYGNAGYLREQVCKYMCPYARFQSAMFDRDTLVISYDVQRGEPRGARKRNADPKALGLGDCVECEACVQACPTGIDIRHGLQIECIACAGCIDACDAVMDKMGYARGLIRYTTESMLHGEQRRVLRPRTIIYALLLAGLLTAFAWGVTHRAPLIVELLHDRNALFRQLADGSVENSYTLKLVNKTTAGQHVHLQIEERPELHILGTQEIVLGAGEVANVPLTVRAEKAPHEREKHFELVASSADGSIRAEQKGEFFAPEIQ